MFSTRRLAKRSIIGTRVSAPWTDGRFYPGHIQSTQTWPNGEEVYQVLFDDGYSKTFRDRDIIGPGFQPVTAVTLRPGQKVFLTHQGREVKGVVKRHNSDSDEVSIELVRVPNQDWGEDWKVPMVRRRLEDVRMLESRRSARLQDQGGQDYSRLADPHSADNTKKKAVSHVIDVPVPAPKIRWVLPVCLLESVSL